ncbi:MAG: HvfX family Cu-binding RiPP maturation protein [Stenotrophomonas sp.]
MRRGSAPLGLRLLLAWEYLESGREKLHGQNWFGDLQQAFPFPFDQLPASLNWQLAIWIGTGRCGSACWWGCGTRLAAASLLVLTVVATWAVHWPMQWDSDWASCARDMPSVTRGLATSSCRYCSWRCCCRWRCRAPAG